MRERSCIVPRSADRAIFHTRRQLQKERKEQLLAEQRHHVEERPWTTGTAEHRHSFQFDSRTKEAIALTRSNSTGCLVQRPRVVYAHPETIDSGIVRREVWRQKFEFLYKQVQEELCNVAPNSSGSTSVHSSPAPVNVQGSMRRQEDAQHSAAVSTASSTEDLAAPHKPEDSLRWHVITSRPMKNNSEVHRCNRNAKGMCPLISTECTNRRSSFSQTQATAIKCSGENSSDWWCSRSLRPSRRQCVATRSRCPVRKTQGVGCRKERKVEAQAGAPGVLLRESASQPLMPLSKELHQLKEDYYCGDELLIHQDVLFSSNPQLFPLHPGPGKPFPLPMLADCCR